MNISGTTSVTLVDLAPNAEYDVEVAAINSNGAISNSLLAAHFTVAPTTAAPPSAICYYVLCILDHIHFILYIATASLQLALYTYMQL